MTSRVNNTAAQSQNQSQQKTQDTETQSESLNSGNPFGSRDEAASSNSPRVEVLPVEVVDSQSEETSEDTKTEFTAEPQEVLADGTEVFLKSQLKAESKTRRKPKAKLTAKPKSPAEPVADIVEDAQPVSETETLTQTPATEVTASSETEAQSTDASASESDADSKAEQKTEPEVDPFKELGLRDDVYKAIKGFGYETPTAIQKETVSVILTGRDVIGQAETGSGKTAAFAWPLLSQIDLKLRKPQILVLAPTRELALQVTAAFEKYGSSMKGLKCVTVYGGQSYEAQFRSLDRGVHVVVGTPGRIMDHINRKTLKLDQVKTFVLDEADEMLRMGFIDDVEWVMERLPESRQTLSFSATMPDPIRNIAKKYLNDPAHITIKSRTRTADSIEQSYVMVNFREKLDTLCRLLETEETDGIIVFVKTRQTTNVVAEKLLQRGLAVSALNGDIAQSERERTVNRLKAGKINILVATDVAARGLDVKRVSHVVNYDFPHDSETYVHRIGRTGRAGREGKAILFVEPKEKRKLGWLEKDTKQKISVFKSRSLDEINAIRTEAFKGKVLEAANDSQMDFFRSLVAKMVEENPHSVETIAAALAVMAQGDIPLLLTDKPTGKKRKRLSDADKATYRVEVGRSHGAGPGNIVGAIANEAGFQNGEIGKIRMMDNYSFIDLPAKLDEDLLEILRGVQVTGQRLQLKLSDGPPAHARRSGGQRRSSGSTHFGKRQKPYRGRNSVSRSDEFRGKSEGAPKRERGGGSESRSQDGDGKREFTRKPRPNKSSEFGGSKPAGKSSSRPKASKPGKKYIKVRTKK